MPDHDMRLLFLVSCALVLLIAWALRISHPWTTKYESVDSYDDTCSSENEADLDEILVREAETKCTVTIFNDGRGRVATFKLVLSRTRKEAGGPIGFSRPDASVRLKIHYPLFHSSFVFFISQLLFLC
jgi:hypothetical protein